MKDPKFELPIEYYIFYPQTAFLKSNPLNLREVSNAYVAKGYEPFPPVLMPFQTRNGSQDRLLVQYYNPYLAEKLYAQVENQIPVQSQELADAEIIEANKPKKSKTKASKDEHGNM